MADQLDKHQARRSKQTGKNSHSEPLSVVGIDACAASFRALLTLFADINNGLDAAYIVAVRQQDGLSVDTVVEALEGHAALHVKRAQDGDRLQPGHIYVGGGDEVIAITDGHIATRPAKERVGQAGAVITFVDVTSTVKAESALRESEARLRTLLAELQHRVRNTLAVVKSITQRTAESSESVEEMATHLSGRLDAFARVQAAVTRNLDAGVNLRSLIDDELLAHAAHEGDGLAVSGPEISLLPRAAESMSLALHELTTNAVKHGALANHDGGRIAIKWRLNGRGNGKDLSFEWVEKSLDGSIPKAERHGFGMELLTRILPYDLGARTSVEFKDSGLRFHMELPNEHLADIGRASRS